MTKSAKAVKSAKPVQTLNAKARLGSFALALGVVTLCYKLSGMIQLVIGRDAAVITETALDKLIAFNPMASWVYVSFWGMILASFLLARPASVALLNRTMIGCAGLSSVIYIAYPTRLDHASILPLATGDNTSHALWRLIHQVDTALASSQNCLPSLHVAITLLCVVAMWRDKCFALWTLWGVAIILSVVQTRRHLSLDVLAGAGLAVAVLTMYYGWYYLAKLSKKHTF